MRRVMGLLWSRLERHARWRFMVTPVKLASLTQAPVYLPSDGSSQVTRAWRCGSTPVFMFNEVQVSFESGWENVKIPAKFEDLARDYGGSVETIQGLPAWVAPSSASALRF